MARLVMTSAAVMPVRAAVGRAVEELFDEEGAEQDEIESGANVTQM